MSVRIRPLPLDVWKMQNAAMCQIILCANASPDTKAMQKCYAQVRSWTNKTLVRFSKQTKNDTTITYHIRVKCNIRVISKNIALHY